MQITANRGAKIDDALKQRVSQTLAQAGVKPKSVENQGKNLLVRAADPDSQTKAYDALRESLGSNGNYVVALNLASNVPSWLGAIGAKPMSLGLDLQGGVHFLMEVDKKAAIDKRFEVYLSDIRSTLRDQSIGYQSVERDGNTLVVTLSQAAELKKAQGLIQKNLNANALDSGAIASANAFTYDAAGNTLRVGVSDEMVRQMTLNAVEQNLGTLRNRVNSLGVAEPVMQRQGADRVVVQLPGVQDTAAAKRTLGATATLEYRSVYEGNAIDARETGNVPPGARLYASRNLGADGKPIPVLLNKRIIVAGEDMVDARTSLDNNGLPAVLVTLNSAGGQRMLQFTTENVNKPMAVVYIERVPQVRIVDGDPEHAILEQHGQRLVLFGLLLRDLGQRFRLRGELAWVHELEAVGLRQHAPHRNLVSEVERDDRAFERGTARGRCRLGFGEAIAIEQVRLDEEAPEGL